LPDGGREQEIPVGKSGVARHVWSAITLAGLVLAAVVWAAWPEPGGAIAPAADPRPVLASVEPDPFVGGPPPVPSELDAELDYVQEPPEDLGAKPLPGAELTPEPPPAAG
jgi:hypothetical protein